MDAGRTEIWLEGLKQGQIDALLSAGVAVDALLHPTLITATRGGRAHDGRFDYQPRAKPDWLAFEEDEDFVFCAFNRLAESALGWASPLATAEGRAFALGEDNIWNPGSYALDGWLSVFPDPLAWLKAGRRGIVIIDWSRVFERLRDAPRILGETLEVAELVDTLMHPARLPAISARSRKTQRGRS